MALISRPFVTMMRLHGLTRPETQSLLIESSAMQAFNALIPWITSANPDTVVCADLRCEIPDAKGRLAEVTDPSTF
jgi:hypothetical protein